MLTVLSFLAKGLGIFVVFVVLLLVTSVLLILFAPIRYRIEAKKNGEEWNLHVRMTYLNPMLRLTIRYPEKSIVSLRLFGVTLYPKKAAAREKDKAVKAADKAMRQDVQSGTSHAEQDWSAKAEEEPGTDSVKATEKKKIAEEPFETGGRQHGLVETASCYVMLLKENQTLILEVLNMVLKALKTTLPQKGSAELVFGTGQPDTTGYLYAVFCSICGFFPGDITVTPVWTEACLEGECDLKGRIRPVHLIMTWIRIRTDQNIQLLYKKMRSVAYGSK